MYSLPQRFVELEEGDNLAELEEVFPRERSSSLDDSVPIHINGAHPETPFIYVRAVAELK